MDRATERPSVVQTVEVAQDGQKFTACYFIEHSIIHASINGRTRAVPVGAVLSPHETVKALLRGSLIRRRLGAANYRRFGG